MDHLPKDAVLLSLMEFLSSARTMRLRDLAIQPRNLCSLLFTIFSKLLAPFHSLLKKFRLDEQVHRPPMEIVPARLPELPPDILMGIFSLLQIPDLVRAGSVCSAWHAAYASLRVHGRYKRQQTPCLLYTSESAGENVACLYSLEEKRSYMLPLPDPPIRSRYLIGSSHGWLVTADERSEMHLVNPVTGEQIALPPVSTIKHVTPIFDHSGALIKYQYLQHTALGCTDPPSILALDELRDYLYNKAFVFYDTPAGSYIVVLIHEPYGQLSFARLGDDKWTWLPVHSYPEFQDCIYMDGLLYAVSDHAEIFAFNLTSPVVSAKLIMDRAKNHTFDTIYLVQAPCGDLLQVWRIQENDDYVEDADPATLVNNIGEIDIFKIDTAAGKLVKKNGLDGHALFIGHNQTLCLTAKEYLVLKENHVYFTDDNELWLFGYKNNRRDIGVLNLDNSKREELVSPQLWSNWPTPVWITPGLTRLCPTLG